MKKLHILAIVLAGIMVLLAVLNYALLSRYKDGCYECLVNGEYESAVGVCTESFNNADDDRFRALALMRRGLAKYKLGRLDEAVNDYTESLTYDPDLAEAYLGRGGTYIDKGMFHEAHNDLDRAISLDPKNAAALSLRGMLNLKEGRNGDALYDLSLSIQMDPDIYETYFNRCLTYINLERYEEALSDINTYTESEPEDHFGLFWKARTLYLMKRYAEALPVIDRAIELSGDNPAYHLLKGDVCLFTGRYEDADAEYERAMQNDTRMQEHAVLMLAAASGHVSDDEFEKSLDLLKSYLAGNRLNVWPAKIAEFYLGRIGEPELVGYAMSGSPNMSAEERLCEAYYHLGEDSLRRGDAEAARGFFRSCIETGMDDYIEYLAAESELARMSGN